MPRATIRELPSEWKKVHLGCNRSIIPGWTNVDIEPFPGVDLTANLEEAWPFEDGSVDYIRAYDLVEHLRDPIHTMNEAYRVLSPGGIFEIWVPSTDGRGAFQDPTHISFWNANSFRYYSQKELGGLYPSKINCNFEYRTADTDPNADQVIWTWALCRAQKSNTNPQRVSDAWYDALSNPDESKRKVAGFAGASFGTMPILLPD